MTELRAILWDMDGTIVDSEPLWQREEQRLMSDAGLDWSDARAASFIGSPLPVTVARMRAAGLPLAQEAAVETLIEAVASELHRNLPWRPGARELLLDAARAGGAERTRVALVTMSERRVARALVDALPGIFDAVVTGDAVERGKPDPEPYLTAMSRLSVAPEECLAFEDSLPGVASARASGAVTIGIEHAVPLAGADAHAVLRSLDGIGMAEVHRLHAAHSACAAEASRG